MEELLIEKSWSAENISNIKMETLFGNVRVNGYDGDLIRVTLSGKYYGWQFWAANRNLHADLEFYDILLEQQGKTLVIKTALKKGLMNWLRFMGMNFNVFVPLKKGFETQIKVEAGNIYVDNYLGDLHLRTGAGKLRLDHVRGEVDAKTFAGTINIRYCKAFITVQTSAGTMEAHDCEGSLTMSTSGGTIGLGRITGTVVASSAAGTIKAQEITGKLQANTAAGNIDIKGMTGGLSALANMGTITAEVSGLGDRVHLEAHAGNIQVQMPIDQPMTLDIEGMQVKAPQLIQFEGRHTSTHISGIVKKGGIPVTIKANAGNIRLKTTQQSPLNTFENTIRDTNFTLPANFFQFDWRGVLLSFSICLLLTYGISGIVFFTLEQTLNPALSGIYTGIVLGYFLNSAMVVGLIMVFTHYFADRIKSVFNQYLVLSVSAFVLTIIDQIILGLVYWQYIADAKDDVSLRQPMFLYLFIPSIIACIYFFFWQRSKQITRKISEQEFQLLSLEKLKTKAELDALQARINPHFLYNSLNSIAGLVHEDPDKAEKMTLLLSKLFRFTIGTKDQHFNTVENELEIVRTYLDIEQVRFGDRLSYSLTVMPGLENVRIPRFLLQPIVENAIKHGIAKISGIGKIIVEVVKIDMQLRCSIHDNGPAFGENFFTGYGLQSVRDKLHLLYGEKASFDIQNTDFKQVVIQIPC